MDDEKLDLKLYKSYVERGLPIDDYWLIKLIERAEKADKYEKVLETLHAYAEERRECHFYLEAISDYTKTALLEE